MVSDGVDVRGHLVTLLASVHLDDLVRVDWVELVGIDHYAEEPRVGLRGGGGKDRGGGLKVILWNYQYYYTYTCTYIIYCGELVCMHV